MQESSISVRRAVPEDAAAIAEVHVATWRTTYRGIVDQAYLDGMSVDKLSAAWARRLAVTGSDRQDILVATIADKGVVGFVSGDLISKPLAGYDAELHAIYLLKEYQHLGIGRRLIREWAQAALDRGLHAGAARVLANNPTCTFIERLGAELLHDGVLMLDGKPYPERWYGWPRLLDLTTEA